MANLQQIYNTLTRSLGPISNGPVGRQSSAEAQLRYLPALQALLLLAQQNNTAYHQGVQGVRKGGLAAAQGIGGVRSGFLQQLSDTPAPTSEAAAHLGLTRDAVAGELAKMQANQIGGISTNVNQLRQKHTQDVTDVVRQLFQTAQQGSLYNTSQYSALASNKAKTDQQIRQFNQEQRNLNRRSGLDAQGNPIPGIFDVLHPKKTPAVHAPVDGVDYQTYLSMTPQQRRANHRAWISAGHTGSGSTLPGGVKPLSQGEHNTFRRDVLNAEHWVNLLAPTAVKNHGNSARHVIATALLTGGQSSSGTKIPSFNQDALTVALDLYFLKGVSRGNRRMLNSLGYSVKQLGFPTYSPTSGVIMHKRPPSNTPAGGDPTGRYN